MKKHNKLVKEERIIILCRLKRAPGCSTILRDSNITSRDPLLLPPLSSLTITNRVPIDKKEKKKENRKAETKGSKAKHLIKNN